MIDEVHTLIGAGAAEGAIDAANILKPALARGELQCIGATTLDEYRKHIEKDPALERYADLRMIYIPFKFLQASQLQPQNLLFWTEQLLFPNPFDHMQFQVVFDVKNLERCRLMHSMILADLFCSAGASNLSRCQSLVWMRPTRSC